MFGSFSSWKVFHQNVDLDWGRWMNFSIYLFSFFCLFTVHFSVCITLLYISYFSILNLECEVGSTHLSSLWNWRHFSAWISGMRTWAKKGCLQPNSFCIIQLRYYKTKIQKWAISLVGLKSSQLIIWKSGSSLIFLQLWSPQIDHDHKLGQIWKITSTNWPKSRQYKASLIGTF